MALNTRPALLLLALTVLVRGASLLGAEEQVPAASSEQPTSALVANDDRTTATYHENETDATASVGVDESQWLDEHDLLSQTVIPTQAAAPAGPTPATSQNPNAPPPRPTGQYAWTQVPPPANRLTRRTFNERTASRRVHYGFADDQRASCGALTIGGKEVGTVSHPALGCTRLNIAENNSPLPSDRVYFRYNHLHNTLPQDLSKIFGAGTEYELHLDRYVFGVEKTLFDELCSIEVRIPTASELAPDIYVSSVDGKQITGADQQDYVLKNVAVLLKLVLLDVEVFSVTGGVGVDLPTAPGLNTVMYIRDTFPFTEDFPAVQGIGIHDRFAIQLDNQTVNLSPFLGWVWTPRPRWFAQGMIQWDHPLNSSPITSQQIALPYEQPWVNPILDRTEAQFHQQDLLRVNISQGIHVLQRPDRLLSEWTLSTELNYTTTLENARIVEAEGQLVHPANAPVLAVVAPGLLRGVGQVGNLANRVDVLNLTLGNTFRFAGRTSVGTGFVVPLRQGDDKRFDFEFVAQINHAF